MTRDEKIRETMSTGVWGTARPGLKIARTDCAKGGRRGGLIGGVLSGETRRNSNRQAYKGIAPIVQSRYQKGESLQTIADWLNSQGYQTVTAGVFHPNTVRRILEGCCHAETSISS